MKKNLARVFWFTALAVLATISVQVESAQSVTAVRVMSNPDGPYFYIDNTIFYHAVSAFWPIGSVHTLYAPGGGGTNMNLAGDTSWTFLGWTYNGGSLTTNPVQVIASPSITQYTATYSTLYKFDLEVTCSPSPCSSAPGTIINGGVATTTSEVSWLAPNSVVTLEVHTNPGWYFAGWQTGPNQSNIGFQSTITLAAPTTVRAVFLPAKMVTLATNPPGLIVYADRTMVLTPATMAWGPGTTHNLTVMELQNDGTGKRWVYGSWSDGGASGHDVTLQNDSTPMTITANYAGAVYPLFSTSPPGMNLVVDGLALPPPYSYIWGDGSKHHISAPVTQTDAGGNSWTFKGWDDLVTAPDRDLTMAPNADQTGFRLTALYTSQAKLTVTSSIPGITVLVDGNTCFTPCAVTRDPGTQVHVSAPLSVPNGTQSRQDFLGWTTAGSLPVAGDWVGTVNANTSINATYHLMNQLTAAASPADSATFTIAPASADGYYDSQTQVSLAVSARPGYRFSGWVGDIAGTASTAAVSMNAPRQVIAQFSRVPYIAASGVVNSAGSLQPGVAPGSVASIFGMSLTGSTATAPSNQLMQTLAGVVVHIGDRMLPMYFASPAQINLQIPPDLALGNQTVTVSSQGMPDVSANFSIVRNAPGIFPLLVDGQVIAIALHEDGSLVLPTSPAKRGELLTLYTTGLGPTDHPRPEGIAVPATPDYLIVDPVSMQVGDGTVVPEKAFAAPGLVGLDLVQFRLGDSAPSGTSRVTLTINSVTSNSVNLPIE